MDVKYKSLASDKRGSMVLPAGQTGASGRELNPYNQFRFLSYAHGRRNHCVELGRSKPAVTRAPGKLRSVIRIKRPVLALHEAPVATCQIDSSLPEAQRA